MNKIVTFGEVLLRLSPPNNLRFEQTPSFNAVYGGSEFNVALSLAKFGQNVKFISRLPENKIADCSILEMCKYGIDTNHILRGGDRLGLYYMEIGAGLRGSQVVYDRQYSAMASLEKGMIDWKTVFKDTSWFHWSGITAGISEGAAAACLEAVEVAEKMGLTISTDFNYRANLWKYGKRPSEVMESIVAKCNVVLAGDYACAQYFDIHPHGHKDKNLSLAEQLQERFPKLKHIAITQRENINASHNNWLAVLYSNTKLITSKTYTITDIVDRIGAGDSFMAGLIYGLSNYEDTQKALDFAVAASALKHTIAGDANLATIEEIENLVAGDISGRVKR